MPKKLTTEEFIKRSMDVHGNLYDYRLVEYVGAKDKVKIFCKKHDLFEQGAKIHMDGHGCPSCANIVRGSNIALTTEKVIEKAIEKYGNFYDYSKTNCVNADTKIIIICPIHGEFKKKIKNFLYEDGCGCLLCKHNEVKNNNLKKFKEKAKEVHGDRYDYSEMTSAKAIEKVPINCVSHGIFLQKSHSHLAGQGCPKCAKESQRLVVTKSSKQFIQDCKKVHGDRYSYEKTEYKGAKEKITFLCNTHGEVIQNASSHLNGQGCPQCARELNSVHMSKTTEQFIEEAVNIYGEAYSYQKTIYKNQSEKIIIICPIHQEWEQKPMYHLRGLGCPRCAMSNRIFSRLKTTEQFIKDSQKVHGDKYTYDNTNYITGKEKVLIFCKLHGNFYQKATSHLQGCGCPNCAKEELAISKIKTTEWFIKKAIGLHEDKYSYINTEYAGTKSKVKVYCIHHGEFDIVANNHLNGYGCQKCGRENTGYGRTAWINNTKEKLCTFYILRCFNEEEEFYKVGRTKNSIIKRYPHATAMPYEYEVISEIKGSAGFIWDLELAEKRKLKKLHYTPQIDFNGSKTECFTDYKL